jgi:hypothetical protein
MPPVPTTIRAVLLPFVPGFLAPSGGHVQVLLVGALFVSRRTLTRAWQVL